MPAMPDFSAAEPTQAAAPFWRPCPGCQSILHVPTLLKDSLRLVRCCDCGLCFANPVPPSCANGSYYTEAAPYYLSPEKLAGDYAPVRFARELRLFRRHCPKGSVLDVGCSTGGFLHALRSRYAGEYDARGMDVSGPALDYAEKQGLTVERAPFLDHNFGGQQFDAVTLWAVLEHVAEPHRFVAKAAELLRPGGHCFILVPNYRSLAVRLLGGRYRYVMPEHLTYFDSGTFRRFLERAPALALVDLRTLHFNPVVLWQDWRGRGGSAAPEQRARLLQRTNAWKTSALLAPLRLGYAATERFLQTFGLADNLVAVLRRRSEATAR